MHTFVGKFKDKTATFSGGSYETVSQAAWGWFDGFSAEVNREGNLDPESAKVNYNGTEHKVDWELAGNLCEIYPAVFSGELDRW